MDNDHIGISLKISSFYNIDSSNQNVRRKVRKIRTLFERSLSLCSFKHPVFAMIMSWSSYGGQMKIISFIDNHKVIDRISCIRKTSPCSLETFWHKNRIIN